MSVFYAIATRSCKDKECYKYIKVNNSEKFSVNVLFLVFVLDVIKDKLSSFKSYLDSDFNKVMEDVISKACGRPDYILKNF